MKLSFLLILFLTLNLGQLYSQVLFNIDIQDTKVKSDWEQTDNLYIRSESVYPFSEIILIPDLGYIFYASSPTQEIFKRVEFEINSTLGEPIINKDYIAEDVNGLNLQWDAFLKSIEDGKTYFYREWKSDEIRVILFWNQYRFLVECFKE